jgi:hypothetical protein
MVAQREAKKKWKRETGLFLGGGVFGEGRKVV